MTTTQPDGDRALDALFATARQEPPVPSADLLARVLADAEAVQAARQSTRQAAQVPRSPRPAPMAARLGGAWRGLLDAVGGWGGVGGLVAAGAAGLWIGFSGTGMLGAASAGLWTGSAAATSDFGAGEVFSLTMALEGDA